MSDSPASHEALEPAEPRPRRLRMRHWLVILLVLVVGLYFAWRLALGWRVEAELEAIRAAGYPATPSELDQWYPDVPRSENAAIVLGKAFRRIHKPAANVKKHLPVMGKATLPPPGNPLPDKMIRVIDQVIAANTEALKLLHKGAAMERLRYPAELRNGYVGFSLDWQQAYSAGRLLALQALWHMAHDRPKQAVSSIHALLGLVRSLSEAPTMISHLVRRWTMEMIFSQLQRLVHHAELSDAALADLIDVLGGVEEPSALSRILIRQRAAHVAFFFHGAPGGIEGLFPSEVELTLRRYTGVLQLDLLTYLSIMNRLIEASRRPLHRRLAAMKAVERKTDNLPLYTPLTRHLVTSGTYSVADAAKVELRMIAQLRAACVALAAQQYRLAHHGASPDALSDLTPRLLDSLPTDPFTGGPLHYEKLPAGGFTVYSVGADKTDNGGAKTNPVGNSYDPGTDIPFTIR